MIQKRHIRISLLTLLVVLLYSCRQNSEVSNKPTQLTNLPSENKNQTSEAHFVKFDPDSISALNIQGFNSDYTYKIGQNYVVVGYYKPIDGQIPPPDTEDNWGDRLLFLDAKKQIVFTSKGAGDVYLYEPHFYKNNDQVIVICQLAYEYFFGGDAYLIENNTIQFIGNLDIENNREEKTLIDILRIKTVDSTIVFSFDADSLLLKPGNETIPVKNNNIRYEFNDKSLKLIRENS